jgi:RNA polymerase sigma-70 factor, ECF subfamily
MVRFAARAAITSRIRPSEKKSYIDLLFFLRGSCTFRSGRERHFKGCVTFTAASLLGLLWRMIEGEHRLPLEVDASGRSSPDLEQDLEQLMKRYQSGDVAAANALVDRLSGKLHLFFSTQMGSRAQADDMLQETWLRIHRARHTYRPGEPLLAWVYAIARRVRIDGYRRRRRIERREAAFESLDNMGSGGRQPHALPSFRELVAPLPENQREILVMLKVNGLSIEEVARATSSTVGSVKQKVHRAYDRLRALLPKGAFGAVGAGEDP